MICPETGQQPIACWDGSGCRRASLEEELAALRARVAELEEDAARLDALEKMAHGLFDVGICPPGNHGGAADCYLLWNHDDSVYPQRGAEWEGKTLRRAIDAAMKEETK